VEAAYDEKQVRIDWLDSQYAQQTFTDEFRRERIALMKKLASNYPDQKELLLPTSFGNTIRAFEVYPRVMYGLEGIEGWSRILAVVPREYRELIDDAKGQVDWWVNLGVMSLCFLIEVWVFIFSRWGLSPGWFYTMLNILLPLGVWSILNSFLVSRAISAAIGWGEYVKSAFDLYRFKLLESISVEEPKTKEDERTSWTKYSQAIIYRLPYVLPNLRDNKVKPTSKKTS
jgi:hypothetical protein